MSATDAGAEHAPARINGRFAPGHSGNPGGKPVGTRNQLSKDILATLSRKWAEKGAQCVDDMIASDPGGFVKVCAGLLPKDVQITTNPMQELSDDELAAAVSRLRSLIAAGAGGGGDREAIEGEASRVLPALPEAAGIPRSGEDAS